MSLFQELGQLTGHMTKRAAQPGGSHQIPEATVKQRRQNPHDNPLVQGLSLGEDFLEGAGGKAWQGVKDYAPSTNEFSHGAFPEYFTPEHRGKINDLNEQFIQAITAKNFPAYKGDPDTEKLRTAAGATVARMRAAAKAEPLDVLQHQIAGQLHSGGQGLSRGASKDVMRNIGELGSALGRFMGKGGIPGAIQRNGPRASDISQGMATLVDTKNWGRPGPTIPSGSKP
mgnify:CR=1 FL=1